MPTAPRARRCLLPALALAAACAAAGCGSPTAPLADAADRTADPGAEQAACTIAADCDDNDACTRGRLIRERRRHRLAAARETTSVGASSPPPADRSSRRAPSRGPWTSAAFRWQAPARATCTSCA